MTPNPLLHPIRTLICFAALALVFSFHAERAAMQTPSATPLDILIVNGKLVDGSGKGARKADVGIRGDRIVFVGDSKKAHVEGARTPPALM